MAAAEGRNRPSQIPVADMFKEPGTTALIDSAPDGFHALGMFDHPEALVAQEVSGGFLIFKRGEENIIRVKKLITAEVLRERGHNYADPANLSMQEILDLRAEVGRRLQIELAGRDLK
jgi:hypothetical protein